MNDISLRNKEITEELIQYSSHHSSKFKFEQGGMLVYDIRSSVYKSSAIMNNHTIISPNVHLNVPSKIHIEDISEEEFELYEKIKQMPPCPNFPSTYILYIPDDNITLIFNSKFESGNLSKVIKLSDYEYKLIVRSDINSPGNNHWYYFSAYNPRKTSISFSIVNMRKEDLLYKIGMKPAVFSEKYKAETGIKWHRDGTSISYKNTPNSAYFTLSFTYNFRYEEDLVYFAYAIPYTYTELAEYLYNINISYSKIARVNTLCYSLAGNPCEIITITNNILTYSGANEEIDEYRISQGARKLIRLRKKKMNAIKADEHQDKKGIILTARVHSGETVSSFVMRGAIEFLLSDDIKAKKLRKNYVFKIIPMLNPDGVRYGNYRCSLLGVDLNRRWDNPNKYLHPTIYHTKRMILIFNEKHKVQFFCDMHGHTRKQNVFMYGCTMHSHEFSIKKENLCAKIVPILMENNKFFSFSDCHFKMESSKKSTARIVIHNELNIPYSYTLEASFYGPKSIDAFGEYAISDLQMNESHLESLGESLCKLFSIFLSDSEFYAKVRYVNNYLKDRNQEKMKLSNNNLEVKENNNKEEIVEDKNLMEDQVWNGITLEESDDSQDSCGSESSPDERLPSKDIQRSKSTTKNKKNNILKNEPCKKSAKFIQSKLKLDSETHSDKFRRYCPSNNKILIVNPKSEPKRTPLYIPSTNKMLYTPQDSNIFSPTIATLDRRNNRFMISLSKEKPKKHQEKISDLPKIIHDKHKNSFNNKMNLSPRDLITIANSWTEEGRHSMLNSISSPLGAR